MHHKSLTAKADNRKLKSPFVQETRPLRKSFQSNPARRRSSWKSITRRVWYPWYDCAPNIIFKVRQNCGGSQNNVIVDENIFQTRWDIPTNLDVTLTANLNACCIPGNPPPPEGNCILMTEVCQIPVTEIGGNSSAAAAPIGFADPNDRDRPFSETVVLYGQFGTTAVAAVLI